VPHPSAHLAATRSSALYFFSLILDRVELLVAVHPKPAAIV